MKNSIHPVIPEMSTDKGRVAIRHAHLVDEACVVRGLIDSVGFSVAQRKAISYRAVELINHVRKKATPSMMENFLAEYGLTTKEGVALMCLAEALLRVPDADTIDDLIEDKILPGDWLMHLGKSESSLVNASTWALLVTGKVIAPAYEKGLRVTLQSLVKRLGEPVVRTAIARSMKELGRHFVLGTDIRTAAKRAVNMESKGYTYSYDMLGEAARTDADARRYHLAYSDAIAALAPLCKDQDIRNNPGISVKLSALHPRYEIGQRERVMSELVARAGSLAILARSANMGFNIDAEESDRLDISLEVIEQVLSNSALRNWNGFGVVVQAIDRRAGKVLDWLYQLATKFDRRIMVRLVKGAYWDTEVKRAQVLGLKDYPVFTRKLNTDISYIACAKKLLAMSDRIYPQFATHNAHSVATILEMASGDDNFEFQRLHGMGESLLDIVVRNHKARCRIYAPVGEHQDLLAYLVRRLLENGANSSFVNQIVDTSIEPEDIARDPFDQFEALGASVCNPNIPNPGAIYGRQRRNSKGWDVTDFFEIEHIEKTRGQFQTATWEAGPIIDGESIGEDVVEVFNPADKNDRVGRVTYASTSDVELAIEQAGKAAVSWSATPAGERAACLRRLADLYESNAEELFALAAREAGKTWLDAVGEVREAVDFALYYANEAERVDTQGDARGVIVCISPWNFPLAIFSGQILAAVGAGNAVIAKPAEQTSLIATRAVELMHEAGIPAAVVQLLPGTGAVVGSALTGDGRIDGVCFTGSTATAMYINRNMAANMAPAVPLIAETGGLNAMVVDSSALPEQVVRDVLASAFQSAGQRCSALRMLYVQSDVADIVLDMLFGAMDELQVGNPWLLATDIGPVIDRAAKQKIGAYCQQMAEQGRLIKRIDVPQQGIFVEPCVIKVDGIHQLEEEIFGPVLHVATFEADEINQVVDSINAKGYGLTFGIHTRVDSRVNQMVSRIKAGNTYVNRNQIGAVVGSQPFGGEGLSGTGPKAGGPAYLASFRKQAHAVVETGSATAIDAAQLQTMVDESARSKNQSPAERGQSLANVIDRLKLNAEPLPVPQSIEMPGPTGETNILSYHSRGLVLCLGPDRITALEQAVAALGTGNRVIVAASGVADLGDIFNTNGLPAVVVEGEVMPDALLQVTGFDAVMCYSDRERLSRYRHALAQRDGVIIPLICEPNTHHYLVIERHLCVDNTAAGGNTRLIAAGDQ